MIYDFGVCGITYSTSSRFSWDLLDSCFLSSLVLLFLSQSIVELLANSRNVLFASSRIDAHGFGGLEINTHFPVRNLLASEVLELEVLNKEINFIDS
jgi:hypothetical protein